MGQLIRFPLTGRTIERPAADVEGAAGMALPTAGAKVLIFTGVRYERQPSLPSERLTGKPGLRK